ncbi:MAG: PQQ-like beta-propeller repeat protein [Thermomicrobiales bacterium]|nr:PQQ-like beta-propeller repeat protein [Thermomicrobiales bacterium]
MYDPAATPLPITPSDPTADPCALTIQTRAGSKPIAAAATGETVDSFDPETGESPWGLALPEQYFVWPVDADRLVAQVEPIQSVGIADNGQRFQCVVDGATGTVSETIGEEFVTFVVPSGKEGAYWGIGVLPSGVTFLVDHAALSIATSLPLVDLGEGFRGFRWVQKSDGIILITGQDGSLAGIRVGAPANFSGQATPTAELSDAANTGWIVPGPNTDHAESEGSAPVLENGRIFCSFYNAIAENHTQAVDMATGDVLWDAPLDIRGEVMASAGNLLLVGGPVGGLLKDFSLVALDQATGNEVWRVSLSGLPVAMTVDGNRAYVLGSENQLDAVDSHSGQPIYAVDIGGAAKPGNPLWAGSSQNRLAIAGTTLVAVLADGSLAGVELESGTGRWWSIRQESGFVQVTTVEGNVIAVDAGNIVTSSTTAGPNATPEPPAPVALASPIPTACLDVRSAGTPTAIDDKNESLDQGMTILRIDPNTGAVIWSVHAATPFASWLSDGLGIGYLIAPTTDLPIDRSQIAFCSMDPATGLSTPIEQMSDLGGQPFIVTFSDATSPDSADRAYVAVIANGDQLIAAPASFDPTVTGPTVSVDLDSGGGTQWGEGYGDALYFSRLDGSLEKIPIPAR